MNHFQPQEHLQLRLKNDFPESLYCNHPSKLKSSEKLSDGVHRRHQKQTEDFYERSLEILEEETNDKIYETFRKPEHPKPKQAYKSCNNFPTGDPQVIGDVTSLHKPLRTQHNNIEHNNINDQKDWKDNVYSNGEILQDCSNHMKAFDNDSYACFNVMRGSQSSNLASVAFKEDSAYFGSAMSQDSQQLTDKLQFEMNGDAPGAPFNSCYESLAETYSDGDKMFLPKYSREMQLIWSISSNLQSDDETDEPMFSQSTINSMNSLLRLPCLKSSDLKCIGTSSSSTNCKHSIEPFKNSLSSSKSETQKYYQNLQEMCLEFASSKIAQRATNQRLLAKTSIDESEYLVDRNKSRIDKADESISLSDYSVECLDVLDRQPRNEKSELYFDHYFGRRYHGNPKPYEYTRYCRINDNFERNTKAGLPKTQKEILNSFPEKYDANISNDNRHDLKFESPKHEMHTYSCWSEVDSSSTVSTVRSCPDIASADESIEPLYDQILSDCVAINSKLSWVGAKRFLENCETDSAEVFCGVKSEAGIRHHSTANWDSIDSNFSNIYINET